MKTLYLIRHAKASSGNNFGGDFERPLHATGIQGARFMGELLKTNGVLPDAVITSSALRTRSTATILCEILGFPAERIEERMEIYEGGAMRLLSIIQHISESCSTAMLIGHNPTITELTSVLSGRAQGGMATGGVAHLQFQVEHWSEVVAGCGTLVAYQFPQAYQ
uniref:Putative phosphohistidine phosphatase, SixA n=1 Tax=Chlorobium chlorochromatii (strain CaD3) TaxID=340177 RepID=Q3AP00_CHLCH